MKTLLFFMITIFSSCTHAQKSNQLLSHLTHTATEDGFMVNSHLIYGENEALLVDAQFTESEAQLVVNMIRKSGKHLKYIYITHGHPDHYFGLKFILRHFSNAKVLASESVVSEIKNTGQGKLNYWKSVYGDKITDEIVVPSIFNKESIFIDKTEIELISTGPAESYSSVALFIPDQKILISGDLLYNQVHLWLAENRPKQWLNIINQIENLRPNTVLVGHGPNSDEKIFGINRKYINSFIRVTNSSNSKKEAIEEMKKIYPNFKLPIILELSVNAKI